MVQLKYRVFDSDLDGRNQASCKQKYEFEKGNESVEKYISDTLVHQVSEAGNKTNFSMEGFVISWKL